MENWDDVIGVLGTLKNNGNISFDKWFCRRMQPLYLIDMLDTFGFQLSKCLRVMDDGVEMCSMCLDSCRRFYRRINSVVKLREAPTSLKTKKAVIEKSPGLMHNTINLVMSNRRNDQIQKDQAGRKLSRLSEGNCDNELFLDKDKFDAGVIFDNQLVRLANEHFSNPQDPDDNDGVSDSSLQKYIFEECIMQSRQANKSGKKTAITLFS